MADKKSTDKKSQSKNGAATKSGQNGQQNPQQKSGQGSFRMQSQYISDLSFECPQPPAHLGQYKNNLKMDVGVQSRPLASPDGAQGENAPETFEVTLTLRGHNKTEDDKTVYLLEMKYSGLFALEGIPQEHKHGLLGVEAPSLLYPFARQLFMGTVGSSGFQPPLLEPINFAALFMQQQQAQQEAQKQKAN